MSDDEPYRGHEYIDFESKLFSLMKESIIKTFREGSWFIVERSGRPRVGSAILHDIWRRVNWDEVYERIDQRLSSMVADKILNSMATEVATDIKSALSNSELRTEIRDLIQERIKSHMSVLEDS